MWQSTAPMTLKMDIFKSSVLSILLYASETWVLNLTQIQRINAFQTSCLRTILDVNRDDRVTNNEVYSRTDMHPLSYTVQQRQLRFLGHSIRRPAEHYVSMYALYNPTHGRPSRGQPPTLYPRYISNFSTLPFPSHPKK